MKKGSQEKAFTLTIILSHQGRGNFLSVIPDPDRGSSVFPPLPPVGEGRGEGEKKKRE